VGGQRELGEMTPARPKKDTEGGQEVRGVGHGLYSVPWGSKNEEVHGWGVGYFATSTASLPNSALQPTPGDRRGPSEGWGRARLSLVR
jgi:hypothetical protein